MSAPPSIPSQGDPASLAVDSPPTASRTRFWDGNRACAEGAIMAGLGFYAGYPITPSTEIAEYLSWRLPQEGGIFIQMEDEIASLAACIGASQGGLRAMTATSGPGFSLMQENIGLACMTEIPLLIVNVQRFGPSTGQPTRPSQGDLMQAIWGTHGDHPIVVVSPSSVEEMMTLTGRALNIAERFRTPVVMLADEAIAHMREKVELPEQLPRWERPQPQESPEHYVAYAETENGVPPMAPFGEGGFRYHVTGLYHDAHGFPTVAAPVMEAWMRRVFRKIDSAREDICAWEVRVGSSRYGPADAERAVEAVGGCDVLLISYGASARTTAAARLRSARRVATLRLQTVWPLDEPFLRALLRAAPKALVVEMNRGQMLREIERLSHAHTDVRGVLRWDGELVTPNEVLAAVEPS